MKPPEDTATIERDLQAVEAALSSGMAGHDDPPARELQELALALRADAPMPDPTFARELHKRADAGFAKERERRRPRLSLMPVAGVAASIFLVAVVVFAAGGLSQDADQGGDGGGGGSVEEIAPQAGDSSGGSESVPDSALALPTPDDRAAGGGITGAPAVPGGFAPGRRERKVERSISMTLTAPDDEIAQVADDVNRVTARHGGFVLRSELDTGDDGASGSFELRIPASRLQGALGDLAKIATVSSQSQTGQDVTREHVTAKDRLQAARAERRSLLRRLEQADTDSEAEAIRARLDLVAGEINGLRGQLRELRLRTDYAIVSVDLVGDGDGESGSSGGAFDDAVSDAGDLLVGFAGVSIRVLAIALPLGLIALVGWLAASLLRRRRRESALA